MIEIKCDNVILGKYKDFNKAKNQREIYNSMKIETKMYICGKAVK